MSTTIDALDYLADPTAHTVRSVCVVYGDELFLQREVLGALRHQVLGDGDGQFSLVKAEGRGAELCEVGDSLQTVSLFGSGRTLVVVEQADPFVTRYRSELEPYFERTDTTGAAGILVLVVKTWPGNTRLAKMLVKHGLAIECRTPMLRDKKNVIDEQRIACWASQWAQNRHGVKLNHVAAGALVEMVSPDFGLLDQELAKLAPMAEGGDQITVELVRQNAGNWPARQTWDMIDAAVEGDAAEALRQLDRLRLSGEEPIAIMGQMAATLRRFAVAFRLVKDAERAGRRSSLRGPLEEAGVHRFYVGKAEKQLKQIGRPRAEQLFAWLVEADLAMKGHRSSTAQQHQVLEELIVRLSRAADPRRKTAETSA